MTDHDVDHGHATKHPRLAELETMVRDGRIDPSAMCYEAVTEPIQSRSAS